MEPKIWKIIESLGEGGQAHTFLVRLQGDEQGLWVKKRLKNVENAERIERFKREIEQLRSLKHPRIVPYVDEGLDEKGKPFVVMPYFVNGTLENQQTPIPLKKSLQILSSIVETLAYLHDQGVVHRDIKPSNILLDSHHEPVLADFGLAITMHETVRLTETQEAIGARHFIAPECEGGRTAPSPTADIYSVGKLFYWLLTGKALPREQYRLPHWRPQMPEANPQHQEMALRVLDKFLALEPSQRPQNGREAFDVINSVCTKISKGGHLLDLTMPHSCSFCMEGTYQVLVAPSGPQRKSSLDWSYPLLSMNLNSPTPILLGCSNCGHIQIFRPDLTGSQHNWRFE